MVSMVKNFKSLMKSQAKAASSIKQKFGVRQALDYLIGEKLYGYLRGFKDDQDALEALPFFIEEIKKYFDPYEIQNYFSSIRRLNKPGIWSKKNKWDDDEEDIFGNFDASTVGKMEEMLRMQTV